MKIILLYLFGLTVSALTSYLRSLKDENSTYFPELIKFNIQMAAYRYTYYFMLILPYFLLK